MPTDLNNISNTTVKVRFKEPLLSEGINQGRISNARGVYKGFDLTPSVTDLTLQLLVDPDTSESVAIAHDANARALTIRFPSNLNVDLTPFASKTVVLALYMQYNASGTTTAVIRGYELSPSDEFTIAPERDELVVFGTVEVPASGTIPAANLSHRFRDIPVENEGPGENRVPLIRNYDFAASAPFTSDQMSAIFAADQIVPLADQWSIVSQVASRAGVVEVRDDAGSSGSRDIDLKTDGSGNAQIVLSQDVGVNIGDVSTQRYLYAEITYEVLITGVSASATIAFYSESGTGRFKTFSLDTSAAGTFTHYELVDLNTISGLSTDIPPIFVSRLNFFATATAIATNTSFLRYHDVQVFLNPAPQSTGYRDNDIRGAGTPVQTHNIVRQLAFMPPEELQWTPTQAFTDRARIETSADIPSTSDNVRHLKVRDASLELEGSLHSRKDYTTAADRLNPAVETRFDGDQDFTLTWESGPDAGSEGHLRMYASRDNVLLFTTNARWSGSLWVNDESGDDALALRFDTTNQELKIQRSTANNFADGAWTTDGALAIDGSNLTDSAVGLIAGGGIGTGLTQLQPIIDAIETAIVRKRSFSAVITDGTLSTGGDFNGVNAIDNLFTGTWDGTGDGAHFFVRRGDYTLSDSVNTAPTGSITVRAETADECEINMGAGIGQDFLFRTGAASPNYFENIEWKSSGDNRWKVDLLGSGSYEFKGCTFGEGELHIEDGKAYFRDCRLSGISANTNNEGLLIDATSATVGVIIENCALPDRPNNAAGGTGYGLRIANTDEFSDIVIRDSDLSNTNSGTTLLSIEDSAAPIVFENCKFLGQGTEDPIVEIINSSNIVFRNCVLQKDTLTGLTLTIDAECFDIVFEDCTFLTSSGGALSQDILIAGDLGLDLKPIVLRNCNISLRNGGTAALSNSRVARIGIGESTITGGAPSNCTIMVDGLFVSLDYTANTHGTHQILGLHPHMTSIFENIVLNMNDKQNDGLGSEIVLLSSPNGGLVRGLRIDNCPGPDTQGSTICRVRGNLTVKDVAISGSTPAFTDFQEGFDAMLDVDNTGLTTSGTMMVDGVKFFEASLSDRPIPGRLVRVGTISNSCRISNVTLKIPSGENYDADGLGGFFLQSDSTSDRLQIVNWAIVLDDDITDTVAGNAGAPIILDGFATIMSGCMFSFASSSPLSIGMHLDTGTDRSILTGNHFGFGGGEPVVVDGDNTVIVANTSDSAVDYDDNGTGNTIANNVPNDVI